MDGSKQPQKMKRKDMKTTSLTSLLILALALSLAATGCRKKPVDVTNLPNHPRTGAPGGGTTPLDRGGQLQPTDIPTTGIALPTNLQNWQETHNQFREILAAHTVHFDYDSPVVKSSEKPHVQAVADYLRGAPGDALLVEGHCDERGTEEYNRSLGERRALAIREALIAAGADGMKITTISYGKDRKINLGADEASHAQNRRGEFVVLRPK